MTDLRDGFIDAYFAECDEHLTSVRQVLLTLEESVGRARPDRRVTEELFRSFHSLKGLAGMVEDRDAELLAHEMESYLRAVRDGEVALSTHGVEALIGGTVALEAVVGARRQQSTAPDSAAALDALHRLLDRTSVAGGSSTPESSPVADWECTFSPTSELSARGINVDAVRTRLRSAGEIVAAVPLVTGQGVTFHFTMAGPFSPELAEAWRADGIIAQPLVNTADVAAPVADLALVAERPSGGHTGGHFVRVELSRLDELMRMIGDLVILRARMADALGRVEPHVPAKEWRAVQENAIGIERQLRELREGVMRVRLVPVGEIFRRMPFVVRDLARESGRRIHVELTGQDTEIDKFVVERMMDPVLHLVRNAVSHGIEPASERVAAGKPPDGRIDLHASAAGDLVTMQIADDGRGIATDRVVARARAMGLPVPSQVDAATVLELICSPGFSTREQSDRASGRGVGMDVVRTTIEELGGAMRLETTAGSGTRFTIELPLTLAITDAFIARVGTETFAVPQAAVREVIEIDSRTIKTLERNEVVPYRGIAMPVIRLASVLNIPVGPAPRLHAFVVGQGQAAVGVIVDRILGQREIVVRATVDPLIQVDGVSGATDLGDGRAVLILDVHAVARGTRVKEIA